MMGFIGFATGFIGFLLHQLIDLISDFKWDLAQEMIEVTCQLASTAEVKAWQKCNSAG